MFSFFPDLTPIQNVKRTTAVEPRYNERPRFVRYNDIEVFVMEELFLMFYYFWGKENRSFNIPWTSLYRGSSVRTYNAYNIPLWKLPYSNRTRPLFWNSRSKETAFETVFESDRVPHFKQGFAWNHKGEAVCLWVYDIKSNQEHSL